MFILFLTIFSSLHSLFHSYLLFPTLFISFLSPNSYSFSIPCSSFIHCLTASLTISSFLWPDSEEQRMGLHQEPQIRHRQQGQVRLSLWQLDFLGDHWGRVRGCEGLLYCRVLGRWLRFCKIRLVLVFKCLVFKRGCFSRFVWCWYFLKEDIQNLFGVGIV